MSQQMVSTPITELDCDFVQKDGRNELYFSIQMRRGGNKMLPGGTTL